jgi:hypothetical protein
MNIREYHFPEIKSELQVAFSSEKTIPEILEEAKSRGFYNGDTPWNKFFRKLFYDGGNVKIKKDPFFHQNHRWTINTLYYLKAFMASFEPKQEEKEAISALILSEIAILPEDLKDN